MSDVRTTTSTRVRSVAVLVADGHEVRFVSEWVDRDRGEHRATRTEVDRWLTRYRRMTGTDASDGAEVSEFVETEVVTTQVRKTVSSSLRAIYLPRYDGYGNPRWIESGSGGAS